MQENHNLIFEKMYGKCVATEKVEIEVLKLKVLLHIYNGFAIGVTKSGQHIQLSYPQLSIIKSSKELANEIIDYVDDIESVDEISPIQIMQTFADVYVDGVKIDNPVK